MTSRTPAFAGLLLAVLAPPAAARPGELDRSYGSRGLASTRLVDGAHAAALARDGRLYVAGGASDPALVRFSARGRRDPRFGPRGRVRVPVPGPMRPADLRLTATGVRMALVSSAPSGPSAGIATITATGGRRTVRRAFTPPVLGPLDGGLRPGGGVLLVGAGSVTAVGPDAQRDPAFAGDGDVTQADLVGPRPSYAVDTAAGDAQGRALVALRGYGRPAGRGRCCCA